MNDNSIFDLGVGIIAKEHKHKEHSGDAHPAKVEQYRTGFLGGKLFMVLAFVLFTALFIAAFYIGKDSLTEKYNKTNQETPSIRNYGMSSADKVLNIMTKFGALFGLALGLLSLIGLFIWYGLASLFKLTKYAFTTRIVLLLVYVFWLWVGFQLTFIEPRYTSWSNGVIFFIGVPLFIASIVVVIATLATIFIPIAMKKKPRGDA